jgi:hypothetical protein
MQKLNQEDLEGLTPDQIIDYLNQGAVIVNASFPFIKDLFAKIKELVQSIQTDKLSTPKGKRLAIEELQRQVEILIAKDVLQKELNKLYDANFAKLAEKGLLD